MVDKVRRKLVINSLKILGLSPLLYACKGSLEKEDKTAVGVVVAEHGYIAENKNPGLKTNPKFSHKPYVIEVRLRNEIYLLDITDDPRSTPGELEEKIEPGYLIKVPVERWDYWWGHYEKVFRKSLHEADKYYGSLDASLVNVVQKKLDFQK